MSKEQALEILTRVGFVARGILYLAIGALVLFVGRAEGADGALKFLSAGIGRWLLFAMAAGPIYFRRFIASQPLNSAWVRTVVDQVCDRYCLK